MEETATEYREVRRWPAGIRGDIRAEELPGGQWIRAVRTCQDVGIVWQR